MILDEIVQRIGDIVKRLQMLAFKNQEIAMCLFESRVSPIDTIEKGGKIQLSTIQKVANSMNAHIVLCFIDDDGEIPEEVELENMIHQHNMKFLDSIIPTVETFMENNRGKNMKTGLVKKSKAQERQDDIRKQLMAELDALDIEI